MRTPDAGEATYAVVGGASAVAAGAVHVALARHHLLEGGWVGPAFVFDGAVLVAFGLLWAATGHRWAGRLTGLAAALTVSGFVVSRTAGLPGTGHHHAGWDTEGLATTGLSLLAVLLAAAPRRLGLAPYRVSVATLFMVLVATAAAAVAPGPVAEPAVKPVVARTPVVELGPVVESGPVEESGPVVEPVAPASEPGTGPHGHPHSHDGDAHSH